MSKTEKNQSETTALAAAESKTAVAVASALSFESDAGMGTEGADKDSFAIPFILVLQPLSPTVVEDKIEGIKAGMFMNSVTNDLFKEIDIIPVAFRRSYLRWSPRKLGGGFKGEYSPIDVETGKVEGMVKGDDGRLYIGGTDPEANDQLKDTRHHFCLLVKPDGTWSQALVSMSSTQIKRSKRWLSQIQGIQMRGANGNVFNPPSFSHIYSASTVKESNDSGTWFSWDIKLKAPVADAELYAAAKAFHAQIIAGQVNVAPPVDEGAVAEGDEKF